MASSEATQTPGKTTFFLLSGPKCEMRRIPQALKNMLSWDSYSLTFALQLPTNHSADLAGEESREEKVSFFPRVRVFLEQES